MPLVKTLVARVAMKAGTALVKACDPAERIRTHLAATTEAADRELGQVSYSVVKALLAAAMESSPDDPAVDAVMAEVLNSPSGPARAFRLLGEARKSASSRRRRLLAAVFFGLPFTDIAADDRDRVDMLVERLVPEDVELLAAIAKLEASESPRRGHPGCFRLVHGHQYLVGSSFVEEDRHEDDDLREAVRLDGPSFTTLLAHGCVFLPNILSVDLTFNGVSATAEYLELTSLGRLLYKAFEDVRPGIEVEPGLAWGDREDHTIP